jgi:hypothetical protein
MDYTRVQHVGRYNRLKVSYSLYYPEYTPHSHKKYKVKRSGNSTLNSVSSVDPFTFDCSSTISLLPRLTCIHKQKKNNYEHASHILTSGLDVSYKIEHIILRDIKSIPFINITKITYNEIDECSSNLVRDPLHQDSTMLPHIFLLSHFSLGKWYRLIMEEKGKNGQFWLKTHKVAANSQGKEGM